MKTTTLSVAISPAPTSVLLLAIAMAPAMAIIMGIDLRIRGAEEILVHGIADEIAHVLTALIMLSALRAVGFRVSWIAVAIGAVAPDVEYLLYRRDMLETIGDGSRGLLHTAVPGLALVLVGLILPPLRPFLVSLGLALLTHVIRDAATSAVPAMWPLTDAYYHLRYSVFLAILAVCATVTTGLAVLGPRPSLNGDDTMA
jgi:hypothetical protein